MVSKTLSHFCSAVLLTFLFSGCAPKGIIYTHVIRPVDLPYGENCKVAKESCTVAFTKLQEPVTSLNISILVGLDEVRWEMEKKGIKQIRYADQETYSFFFGSFERRYLILYGDKIADPPQEEKAEEKDKS